MSTDAIAALRDGDEATNLLATGAYLGTKAALLRFERAKTREIANWLDRVHGSPDAYGVEGDLCLS